jgi:predicted Zn-dependent peptidase
VTELRVCFPRVGSYLDWILGLAHFAEHMGFKGAKGYKRWQTIRELEDLLFFGTLNAETKYTIMSFGGRVRLENLNLAGHLLRQFIFFPTLREEDIATESGVIVREIYEYFETPRHVRIIGALRRGLYGSHTLGRFPSELGYHNTVCSITAADFRRFKNSFLHAGNMALFFVGDITMDQAIRFANRFERDLPRKQPLPPWVPITDHWPVPQQREHRISHRKAFGTVGIQHAKIRMTRLLPRTVPQAVLDIAGKMLDARLMDHVRDESGKTYHYVTEDNLFPDHVEFMIKGKVAPGSANKVRDVTFDTLHRLSGTNGDSWEGPFKRAVKSRLDHLRSLEWDPGTIINSAMDEYSAEGHIQSATQLIRDTERVTLTDVFDVVRTHLQPETMHTSMFLP